MVAESFKFRATTLRWVSLFRPMDLDPGLNFVRSVTVLISDGEQAEFPTWVADKFGDMALFGIQKGSVGATFSNRGDVGVFGISEDWVRKVQHLGLSPDRAIGVCKTDAEIMLVRAPPKPDSRLPEAFVRRDSAMLLAVSFREDPPVPTFEGYCDEVVGRMAEYPAADAAPNNPEPNRRAVNHD